ncbi:MAG: alanine racemase [Candidatus Woykebacteria bacterium RBG_19FT_COMBO_43_10]|uniref:Alanine racemase n=1 Tax=Candidatus Woykebacteria bacterium RBG_19FT_COMBO_43_10 TaxID=1802598 RepID=A0A1G1WJQ8_9BACT|nr:MAG: alanine racemase [Candidatus Woykebacteria bacterium RBG_19FT_COMBO_43_10]
MALERLTWCEISKEALSNNIKTIQEFVGPKVAVMAVVKANAYGHGAVETALIALKSGAKLLGVSSFVEAKQLREADIKDPIVILGFTPAENYLDMVRNNLTVTIRSLDVARALSTAARREEKITRVWVKVDTGMHRLGLNPGEVLFFIKKIQNLPNLSISGLFTHFAQADTPELSFSEKQIESFNEVLGELESEGIHIPLRSAANSAAIFKLPKSHYNLVRVGIAMYGLKPEKSFDYGVDLKPALTFKTEITQIIELAKGESVGYGREFVARGPTLIATLAVGYGDGFRRSPKNWGEVLIRGQRAPLVGRVSMDQAAADITDLKGDIRRGEEVALIGRSGDEVISAEDVAENLGTISYEVVTAISARVPRIYL